MFYETYLVKEFVKGRKLISQRPKIVFGQNLETLYCTRTSAWIFTVFYADKPVSSSYSVHPGVLTQQAPFVYLYVRFYLDEK